MKKFVSILLATSFVTGFSCITANADLSGLYTTTMGGVPFCFEWSADDDNVFVKGDDATYTEFLERSSTDEALLAGLFNSYCVLAFPVGYTSDAVDYYTLFYLYDGYTENGIYLTEYLNSSSSAYDELEQFIKNFYSTSEIAEGSVTEETFGNYPYLKLQLQNDFSHQSIIYTTIINGDLLIIEANCYADHQKETIDYAAKFMNTFYEPAADTASAGNRTYSFENGLLTVTMDEDKYDIITQDNTNNQRSVERQGYGQERLDLYMTLSGYALQAVPVGQSIADADEIYRINIKDKNYPGLMNLKDMSDIDINLLATALVTGFNGSNQSYDLYQTDQAVYIVFNCDSVKGNIETRYATVIDERMIYFFNEVEDASKLDESNATLKAIVDSAIWK